MATDKAARRSDAPAKLTPAQEGELLTALRAHPAAYQPTKHGVALRLCAAGMLQLVQEDPPLYRLTPTGVDHGARLSAQRVIDAVNAAPRRRKSAESGQAISTAQIAAAEEPKPVGRALGVPAHWPFPVSGHSW